MTMLETWIRDGIGWGIRLTVAGFTTVLLVCTVIGLFAAIGTIAKGDDHDKPRTF